MKKKLSVFLAILLVVSALLLCACSSNEYSAELKSSSSNLLSESSGASYNSTIELVYSRNASVSISVDDIKSVCTNVENKAKELGGYKESAVEPDDDSTYARYSFYIPEDKLDDLVAYIKSCGKVESSRTSTVNVTEESIEFEAELEALESELTRLNTLYADPSTTTTEKLSISTRITEVQTKINKMQTQKDLYGGSVVYSTVDFWCYKEDTYEEPTLWEQICETLFGSAESVGKVFEGLLLVVVALLPYAVTIAVIFGVYCLIKLIVCKIKGVKFTLFKKARERHLINKKSSELREQKLREQLGLADEENK